MGAVRSTRGDLSLGYGVQPRYGGESRELRAGMEGLKDSLGWISASVGPA